MSENNSILKRLAGELNYILLTLHNKSEMDEVELCFLRGVINEMLELIERGDGE